MNGQVVVDAGLAAKWLVNEVHTEKALALARTWARSGVQPVAPYLMPVEVSNVLYRRLVQGQISLEVATRLLGALLESGIELREPAGLHRMAIELAVQLRLDAAYDSHYLALAEILNCELWTADQRFFRVASPLHRRVRWLGSVEG
ncbi:MAG: type II toxin-antitoxin system VapC family toxin [Chloroflexi bacterium]|nr:type II toxin-antitoxin system VapC family toxin [Chloroflexota bacterium]